MKYTLRKIFIVFFIISSFAVCRADILTVDDDGPADFNTIQSAINAASYGDIIQVAPGTYGENIRLKNGISLHGSGADVTVIDGGGNGHVVVFNMADGDISGFTIFNSGHSPIYRSGIFVSQSSVTIENNIIANNANGISASSSSVVVIKKNRIENNMALFGSGVEFHSSSGVIVSNIIANNNNNGGIYCSDSSPSIINNTIYNNFNYGIRCNPTSLQLILNNIIAYNEYGIMAVDGYESPVSLLNMAYNDVWNNTTADYWAEWGGVSIPGGSESFMPQPGTGEISQDPCFINITNGDYHLRSEGWRWDSIHQMWDFDEVTSPCIDAGNPGCPLGDEPLTIPEDPNNEWGINLRIDMGAFGGMYESGIPPYNWSLLADLTNDGIADCDDLSHQINDWLQTADCLFGDLDRNKIVNFFDIALLASDWLKQTSWHQP